MCSLKYSAFNWQKVKGWRNGHQWRSLGNSTGTPVVPPQSSALRGWANSGEGLWSSRAIPEASPEVSIPPPFGHSKSQPKVSCFQPVTKGGRSGRQRGNPWTLHGSSCCAPRVRPLGANSGKALGAPVQCPGEFPGGPTPPPFGQLRGRFRAGPG